MTLPLLHYNYTVITNDWYCEEDPYKGLHIVALGEPIDIETEISTNCKLMCQGCLKHFAIHKLKNIYVEYYWETNAGTIYVDFARHTCSTCYLKCVDLLEQELPDCKEPDIE